MSLGFLELCNTVVTGLSEDGTLADVSLAASATDADLVDNVALSALVAETAGFINSRGALNLVDHRELAVLPGPDTENKSNNIRLFLLPKFF